MIKTLLTNENDSKLIIFQDKAAASGGELFTAFLSNYAQQTKADIHIVCVEKPSAYYLKHVPLENLKPIDIAPNSKLGSAKTGSIFTTPSLLALLSKRDFGNQIVFIDSVSPFLWNHGVSQFAGDLMKLASLSKRVLIHVHSDTLLGENDAILLQHICSTHIDVIQRRGPWQFLVVMTQKKFGGKGLARRQTELVDLGLDGSLNSSIFTNTMSDKPTPRVIPMQSLTTFNLGVTMSETEKQARDHLVLPYLRTSEEPNSKIFYEADDADLEEDPDEDLEL